MRIIFSLFLLFSIPGVSQNNFTNDSAVIYKMQSFSLEKSILYDDLRVLCKQIGNRISGSPAAAKAVIWAKTTLEKTGCDTVFLQPVMVPHWVRKNEKFSVTMPNKKIIKFNALGLGNSVGTEGKIIKTSVIMVNTISDLNALGKKEIEGKIVFFNYRWDQKKANPFNEYGPCGTIRRAGPSQAAKYGAIACVIRSVGSAYDNFAHTGSLQYDSAYEKIPAMALSYLEANDLEKICKNNNSVNASMSSNSRFEKEVLSYNVIGEIKGTDFANEVITFGGHLDSWDVGEGAHDDGAGVVQSIEVLRSFVVNNIKPKRTLRCVLFMNEENGLRGANEYSRWAKLQNEKHICAIETDAGGFSPRGFGITASVEKRDKIKSWKKLFYPLGVYDFENNGGGADIGPMNKTMGTPLLGLQPDPQRYFDLHHTNNDVFEQVNRRELALGAVALSAMIFMISEYGF